MIALIAYSGIDMGPFSESYLPPESLLSIISVTTTQVDAIDPLGRLQRYFGTFVPADLEQQKYDTSTVTGYEQYDGSAASTLLYEFSGASINLQVALDFTEADQAYALGADIFKGADVLIGSNEDDTLVAFAGADQISGSVGSDSIFGGDGWDFLNGNEGQDVIDGEVGRDVLHGGRGRDSLIGGADDDRLFGDLGADQLFGGTGSDHLNGNRGNDTSTGGLGADTFVLSKDFDVILDFSAEEGDTIEILSTTPYILDSTEGGGIGDVQIIRAQGTTTLLGVSFSSFDPTTSIVLI